MSRIYLDHAATTPLRPEAAEAMRRGFEIWANPSSPHAEGRKARAALEDARERVKTALGWDGEVIFTSGASEAAALAFNAAQVVGERFSRRGEQIVDRLALEIEHEAILQAAHTPIGVNADGSYCRDSAEIDLITCYPAIMAVQHVNSETGNRQDIRSISPLAHEFDGLLLVDCAQSAGKFSFPIEADLAILSAHKFGGPIGVGALLVRDFAMLKPAGGQERGYRRGTENLPATLGMAAALETCAQPYIDPAVLAPLDDFAEEVRAVGGVWLSDQLSAPTPYIRAVAMPGLSGSAQLMRFDMLGISLSQGSACSSGTLHASHVLKAMGLDDDMASRTIRVSFGWNTTRAEVEHFCEAWLEMAREGAGRAA